MLKEIMTAIGLGRSVARTISDLKNDAQSARMTNVPINEQATQVEALEKRISDLEAMAREQENRLQQVQKGLSDAVAATEAVALRASTIFWVSAAGCALSVFAVAISITALALHR